MKSVAVSLLFAASTSVFASCPEPMFSSGPTGSVNKPLVLMVHASHDFDSRKATSNGIEFLTKFAHQKQFDVLHLKDDAQVSKYFASTVSCDGTWWKSGGGEMQSYVVSEDVHVAGGHLEYCFNTALNQMVYGWKKQNKRSKLKITYYADAIYSNGKLVYDTDPYYNDFKKFINVTAYGRPGGEYWPKVTLLETLGIIANINNQYEYIQRALPRFDTSLPDYKVTLKIDGLAARVLQDPKNAVGELEFVIKDSAMLQ
jgi:hypothetical protein